MFQFHLHHFYWTDWSITERGTVVDYYKQNIAIGDYITQNRHCQKCGYTQTKRQSSPRFLQPNHHLIPTSAKVVPKHDTVKG